MKKNFILIVICWLLCWIIVPHEQAIAQTNKSKLNAKSKVAVPQQTTDNSQIPLDELSPRERTMLLKMQYLLRAVSNLKRFSGVAIIAKNGVPIYKYTSGYSNLNNQTPTSLNTTYNTAAVTEVFTSLAIMQLAEKGVLNLHAPLSTYLPELPSEIGNKLTLHHLLTHTSGLLDYYQSVDYITNFFNIKSTNDLLNVIVTQNAPCNTAAHQFTNSGYVLLGAVIERMSNMSYKDYLQRYIFQPANMTETQPYFWHQVVPNKAMGYTFDNSLEAVTASELWGAFPMGADGVYSTADDLIRFSNNLDNYRLLSPDYQKIMFADYTMRDTLTQKFNYGYGYGWKKRQFNNKRVLFQGGYLDGLSVQLRKYPDDGYTIVVCSNYHLNTAADLADRLEQIMYDDNYFVPADATAFVVNELLQYEGVVSVVNNFDRLLTDKRAKLETSFSLNSLANEYSKQGNSTVALELLKLNAKYFPDDPIVWEALGDYYHKKKDYQKSLEYFQRKLNLLPADKRTQSIVEDLKTGKK
ncbi:MAG: serine hydrolase [Chitinophagales bacterium]|jgi:CubicO group peptidase (beta-lactamase class C family)|nr:serine hydrolase [Chitinophagales bacterium]